MRPPHLMTPPPRTVRAQTRQTSFELQNERLGVLGRGRYDRSAESSRRLIVYPEEDMTVLLHIGMMR